MLVTTFSIASIVRFSWNRFGPFLASDIRKGRAQAMRAYTQWRWHLDEVFVKSMVSPTISGGLSITRGKCLRLTSPSAVIEEPHRSFFAKP